MQGLVTHCLKNFMLLVLPIFFYRTRLSVNSALYILTHCTFFDTGINSL
jgi:hypothetical protein